MTSDSIFLFFQISCVCYIVFLMEGFALCFDLKQKRQVQMCVEAETWEADLSVSGQIRGGMRSLLKG